MTVVAEGADGDTARLPLSLTVRGDVAGAVSLQAEYAELSGSARDTFTYSVTLRNSMPDETSFAQSGAGPPGWEVEAHPAEQWATTVTVEGGGTATVQVTADPPDNVTAGAYPIPLAVGRSLAPARRSGAAGYGGAVRIVSLLPSTTEILFALGAGDQVVGVTFECDHPPQARQRRIVSTSALPEGLPPAEIDKLVAARMAAGEDLYHLDRDALAGLDADLVVTQDLCAVCAVDVAEVRDAVEFLGCRAEVLTIDPPDLAGVLESIVVLGAATGTRARAEALVAELTGRLEAVAGCVAAARPVPTLVLEWTDPPFAPGHWVPDMVARAGGRCVLGVAGQRSYRITWAEAAAAAPEVVVCAPCGFDLTESARLAAAVAAAGVLPPGLPVWAVDANASFARPGPRLIDGIEALAAILHPDVAGDAPAGLARRVA